MDSLRILLLSGSRPSRAWKIAERIKREIPAAEISGIVQQAVPQLPVTQQLIAAGDANRAVVSEDVLSRASRWLHCALEGMVHWVVWCLHGCPRGLNIVKKFTTGNLEEKCRQTGYPLLLTCNGGDARVLDFIQGRADLVIVLGEVPLSRELLLLPSCGLVRVSQCPANGVAKVKESTQISVEHFARSAKIASTVASLAVPSQPYDGLLGMTLKTDLIADDLLVETAKALQQGSVSGGSEEVTQWVRGIYSPYLAQLEDLSLQRMQSVPVGRRYRAVWKLCLDTLLLCSPLFVVRNWYRRLRGQYPVLILTHHLISDRPHRMGISTETFWRQVRFLQRHYRIVTLDHAVELLRSGSVTVPTVVLTFDDGYRDNFVSLRAIADEAGVPVSLFVTTEPVDVQREFQHDLASGSRGHLPLTWRQIRYWAFHGAEFGSHTRTHVDCGSADRATLEQEMVGSKKDLEDRLGMPVRFFAFPFGNPENLSLQAIKIAASVYQYFASGLDGENLPVRNVAPSHLFRKNLYPNPWELELELQSVFHLVDGWKRKFLSRPQSDSSQSSPRATSTSPTSGEFSSICTKDN